MSAPDLQAIQEAIGQNADDDYILRPEVHQATYQASLPGLAKVLGSSQVKAQAEEYQRYDQQANLAQAEYKKFSRRARRFTFLTAIVSSLLVMLPGLAQLLAQYGRGGAEPEATATVNPTLVIVLSLLGVVTGGLASTFVNLIRNRKLLPEWMEKRAKAEEYRLLYFATITEVKNLAADAHAEVLARLEYFRRYLLEQQKSFYTIRSQQLDKRGDGILTVIAYTAGAVAIINGSVAVLSGGQGNTGWTALAGVALMVQAYSNMRNNQELSEQNQRNATRYDNTRSVLVRLYSRLDEVREGITEGRHELLPEYVAAVHEPLSNENRQWLKEMDLKNSAIGKLEEDLASLKEKPKAEG